MKKIENIFFILSIVGWIWLFASLIDVNMHNLSGGCATEWNIFVLMVKYGKM